MSQDMMPDMYKELALKSALQDLSHTDPRVRADARHVLLELGTAATPALVKLLAHPSSDQRWEAAKTLSTMGDPAAIEALIATLNDARQDIRWLAALGLIAIGKASIRPVLRGLMADPDNVDLQHGTRHILTALRGRVPNDLLAPVITALNGPVPTLEAPLAALRALDALRQASP